MLISTWPRQFAPHRKSAFPGQQVQGAKLTAIWYCTAVLGCGSAWGCVQRIPPWVQKLAGLESAMGVRGGLGPWLLDAGIVLNFPSIFFILRKGGIKCFKEISKLKSFYFTSLGKKKQKKPTQWKLRKTRTSVPSPAEEGAATAAAAHPWGSFPSAAGARQALQFVMGKPTMPSAGREEAVQNQGKTAKTWGGKAVQKQSEAPPSLQPPRRRNS